MDGVGDGGRFWTKMLAATYCQSLEPGEAAISRGMVGLPTIGGGGLPGRGSREGFYKGSKRPQAG